MTENKYRDEIPAVDEPQDTNKFLAPPLLRRIRRWFSSVKRRLTRNKRPKFGGSRQRFELVEYVSQQEPERVRRGFQYKSFATRYCWRLEPAPSRPAKAHATGPPPPPASASQPMDIDETESDSEL